MTTPIHDSAVARLRADVNYLASQELGGRTPGSGGHALAASYIERRMREIGLEPLFGDSYGQLVPTEGMPAGLNLCGVLPGRSERRLLIGAHYDTLRESGPGADDNAAAVAIALEVAQALHPWTGDTSIVFAFFDQEEPPYFGGPEMGSVVFAQNPPFDLGDLECALVLDLCGHDLPSPTCPEGVIVMGAENHQVLTEALADAELPEVPFIAVPHQLEPDQSDHLAFRALGVPFLFFSCGRWQHYHAPTDTVDVLNVPKMAAISKALERTIRGLDGLPAGAVRASAPSHDFFVLAARGFERLTGHPAPDDPAEMSVLASEWADSVGLR